MVGVPAETPVTIPLLTVANDALLLLQVPPEVPLMRVVVSPGHTLVIPVSGATVGNGVIVTVALVLFTTQTPLVTTAL